jgi:erythronate-4-phosphate dehydrogenase
MIIAVDDAVAYAQEAFGPLGEVRLFGGRSVSPDELRDADALVVRSVTRVNERLLAGSRIRFVGTATIGTDHLDLSYLRDRGIQVANAAGCNANAVADYVMAALLLTAGRKGWNLAEKSIGIIGVGHIGSRIQTRAAALGMSVRLCDPPLRESTGDLRYGFLDDVLAADILTLHVPLTREGAHPTWHLIDRNVLRSLNPGQVLLNTARGPVIAEADLKECLRQRKIAGALLDVWESEPGIDPELLDLVEVATPHIAGYSLDGKIRATRMIADELCRFLHLRQTWDPSDLCPPPHCLRPQAGARGTDALRSLVLQAYDILKDDASLRAIRDAAAGRAEYFERLRTDYPFRPEFSHFMVQLDEEPALTRACKAMGFILENEVNP